MQVELIESMGSDLTVTNSARVSFDKHKDVFDEKDERLVSYLASHLHTSPFRHCFATLRVSAPIFVARQLVKHQVGLAWNEVSRRYVDSEPEFYWPDAWRAKAENKKQGSGDNLRLHEDECSSAFYFEALEKCKEVYKELLYMGVAPEQARIVLPQSMYTSWYWSGSLQAFAHVCNLRCKPDAQVETKVIADKIDEICKGLWPVSWAALRSSSESLSKEEKTT
jgi:thymidylate synthase (FAD)